MSIFFYKLKLWWVNLIAQLKKSWLNLIAIIPVVIIILFSEDKIKFQDYISKDHISTILLFLMIGFGTLISVCSWGKENKMQNIPTMWTSLGILGTFISLYIAFKDGDLLNGTGNIKNDDIKKLISILSGAFSTSIVGVIYSQVYSIILRNKDDKRCDDKDCYSVPPEQNLYEINYFIKYLCEITEKFNNKIPKEEYLKEIRDNIKELNDKVNVEVGVLSKEFKSTMKVVERSLVSSTKSINEKTLSMTVDKAEDFRKLLENISRVFEDVAKSNSENYNKKFESLQIKLFESMSEMTTSLDNNLKNINEKLELSINKSLEGNIKNVEKVSNEVLSLSDVVQNEFHSSIDKNIEHSKKTYDAIEKNSLNVLNKLNEISEESSKKVYYKTEEILLNLDTGFTGLLSDIKDFSKLNEDALDSIQNRLQQSVITFDKHGNNNKEIIKQLEDHMKNISLTNEYLNEMLKNIEAKILLRGEA